MNPVSHIRDRQAPPPAPPGGERRPEVERDTRKSPGITFYMRRHADGRCCVLATCRHPYTIVGYASGHRSDRWDCTRECFAFLRATAARFEATAEEEDHAGH
jgi:hypothetical protein